MVAVAMTWRVALRRPLRKSGSAIGASTFVRTCHPVMPMPRAASRAAGSTLPMPAYVPDSSGGIASRTSTVMLGMTKARSLLMSGPTNIETANSRPRVGTARAALAPVTSQRMRPEWPTHAPSGTATTSAMSSVSPV